MAPSTYFLVLAFMAVLWLVVHSWTLSSENVFSASDRYNLQAEVGRDAVSGGNHGDNHFRWQNRSEHTKSFRAAERNS